MIIETQLRHGGKLIRDRIMISEVELLHLPKSSRKEIIKSAKRIGAARCVQRWLAQLAKQKTNKTK
jgi:hypothetical protein